MLSGNMPGASRDFGLASKKLRVMGGFLPFPRIELAEVERCQANYITLLHPQQENPKQSKIFSILLSRTHAGRCVGPSSTRTSS
jgi:hypothetical protein